MDQSVVSSAVSLLDDFMVAEGPHAPSVAYIVGYAHALLNIGAIDSNRWQIVTDWADGLVRG